MAELAVARRAAQQLAAMPTPVLLDLWSLWADAKRRGDAEETDRMAKLLWHQVRVVK